MGAGAKNKALQVVEGANAVLRGEAVPPSVSFLAPHGISRVVDRTIRQLRADESPWHSLSPDRVASACAVDPGMVVALGSHVSGYVREAVLPIASELLYEHPGIVTMLAQRTIDPVPSNQAPAQDAIRKLLVTEIAREDRRHMETGANRASREIVGAIDSVRFCPDLVMLALELFATSEGKYRRDGTSDHHLRTLREIERRTQVLEHLKRIAPDLIESSQQQAAAALIEFYDHSLAPPRRNDLTTTDGVRT